VRVKAPCVGGYRRVQTLPKEGEMCMLHANYQTRNDGMPAEFSK